MIPSIKPPQFSKLGCGTSEAAAEFKHDITIVPQISVAYVAKAQL
jgi:hypothetical protein